MLDKVHNALIRLQKMVLVAGLRLGFIRVHAVQTDKHMHVHELLNPNLSP